MFNQFRIIFLSICLLCCGHFVWAAERPLNIVSTQTIFADLVKKVGKEKVNVTTIASPKYNVHFIQPKPSDVRKVTQADLYVNAGLDLEAWSDLLLEAAGRSGLFRGRERNLDLSQGIKLLNPPRGPLSRAQGDIHLFGNPHYHMNPANAAIMIKTILNKLQEIDPANSSYYEKNTKEFFGKLEKKISEWQKMCAHCRNKEIISYHDDIVYFVDFLGIKSEEFLEPKPGIPPTPKHLQFLEGYAQEHQIKAIVLPTYYSRSAAEQLAKKLDVKIIILCQNVGELPGTEDFFGFFDYNVEQINRVLQ